MKRDVRYLDLPTELWGAIEDAAAAAGRSVDMDVRLRLEAAIKADAQQHPTAVLVMPPDREAILREALSRLTASPPETKGMDPQARAARFRAELERRAAFAKEALANAR